MRSMRAPFKASDHYLAGVSGGRWSAPQRNIGLRFDCFGYFFKNLDDHRSSGGLYDRGGPEALKALHLVKCKLPSNASRAFQAFLAPCETVL